ncbi:MAG: hypothetical protein IPP80_14425 [Ignavibacteria bacterium]|nr:hypothetical protein [Ignavibacteria bacterium]
MTHLSRAARIARQHGVDSTFVASLLRAPQTAFNDRFVRINVWKLRAENRLLT